MFIKGFMTPDASIKKTSHKNTIILKEQRSVLESLKKENFNTKALNLENFNSQMVLRKFVSIILKSRGV